MHLGPWVAPTPTVAPCQSFLCSRHSAILCGNYTALLICIDLHCTALLSTVLIGNVFLYFSLLCSTLHYSALHCSSQFTPCWVQFGTAEQISSGPDSQTHTAQVAKVTFHLLVISLRFVSFVSKKKIARLQNAAQSTSHWL